MQKRLHHKAPQGTCLDFLVTINQISNQQWAPTNREITPKILFSLMTTVPGKTKTKDVWWLLDLNSSIISHGLWNYCNNKTVATASTWSTAAAGQYYKQERIQGQFHALWAVWNQNNLVLACIWTTHNQLRSTLKVRKLVDFHLGIHAQTNIHEGLEATSPTVQEATHRTKQTSKELLHVIASLQRRSENCRNYWKIEECIQ